MPDIKRTMKCTKVEVVSVSPVSFLFYFSDQSDALTLRTDENEFTVGKSYEVRIWGSDDQPPVPK